MKLQQLFENKNNLITPTKFKNYYIEACPEEYMFESKWGPKDVYYNCTSETDGYKNTVQMYLHGNELAHKVLNLVIDGKDDWHIPAKDELNHIYKSNIIKFKDWCWSSTEDTVNWCWVQIFNNGAIMHIGKTNTYYALAVRRVYEG